MEGMYLLTTSEWFIAPDGKQYRSVWGKVEIVSDEILGVKTNRNSVNWYAKVSGETHHIIIAGCQINYAIQTDDKPHSGSAPTWDMHEGKVIENERPCSIYFPR